jgi:RsiW-degrading membrane proteinase PrsW (M82 family)
MKSPEKKNIKQEFFRERLNFNPTQTQKIILFEKQTKYTWTDFFIWNVITLNYRILIILLFISAFLVLAHQAVTSCSGWFKLSDFLHHENIAAVIIAFACGILFSVETKRKF